MLGAFVPHCPGSALRLSPRSLSVKVRVPTEFKKQQSLEHLYPLSPDLEHIRTLAGQYDTQQDFFKSLGEHVYLEAHQRSADSVRGEKVDGSLTFRELSEGEQPLLMVLGFTSDLPGRRIAVPLG